MVKCGHIRLEVLREHFLRHVCEPVRQLRQGPSQIAISFICKMKAISTVSVRNMTIARNAHQERVVLVELAVVEDEEELDAVGVVARRLDRVRLAGGEVPERSLGLP